MAVSCREKQWTELVQLFGEPKHRTKPCIMIDGHTATGKTLVLEKLMAHYNLPHAMVNLVEFNTPRMIYEHILNQLAGEIPSAENGFMQYCRCDNMNDFVRTLRKVANNRQNPDHTMYIVLDNAERLREMPANLLPALVRLQQLSGVNVCVVLIGQIIWECFSVGAGTGYLQPIMIRFTDYSKEDLVRILSLDCPSPYNEEPGFYEKYLTLVLGVFYPVCRDLRELRHLAKLHFSKYVQPVEDDEVGVDETRRLWRNIEPHLKRALHTVYLREVSTAQWEQVQEQQHQSDSSLSHITHDSASSTASVSQSHTQNLRTIGISTAPIEMPFYSKYLLIAAYLASYNPAKCDKRFFLKRSDKMTKRGKLALNKKDERTSNHLLGPKPFPLDRLLAIFYSIVDGKVPASANIPCQIASLTTHSLVTQISIDGAIDSPKYKCTVSLEFVKGIARTVSFDIMQYLYDFI